MNRQETVAQDLGERLSVLLPAIRKWGEDRVIHRNMLYEAREGVPEDSSAVAYRWANFCQHGKLPQTGIVLCEPERADSDLANTHQLTGKMALAKRGGNSVSEKAQLVTAAGAVGLIIVNRDDKLEETDAHINGQRPAAIPVVLIRAKDAQALLSSGHSSSLQLNPRQQEAAEMQATDSTLIWQLQHQFVCIYHWLKTYQNDKAVRWLEQKNPIPVVALPFSVSNEETLFQWYEGILKQLLDVKQ